MSVGCLGAFSAALMVAETAPLLAVHLDFRLVVLWGLYLVEMSVCVVVVLKVAKRAASMVS